jgi:hypothetical protein
MFPCHEIVILCSSNTIVVVVIGAINPVVDYYPRCTRIVNGLGDIYLSRFQAGHIEKYVKRNGKYGP